MLYVEDECGDLVHMQLYQDAEDCDCEECRSIDDDDDTSEWEEVE